MAGSAAGQEGQTEKKGPCLHRAEGLEAGADQRAANQSGEGALGARDIGAQLRAQSLQTGMLGERIGCDRQWWHGRWRRMRLFHKVNRR
jgi:hypothetical protein